MYLQLPGYRKHIIKETYTVWLPPIPPREQIHGWQLKKDDQVWRRQPLPKFYEERRGEEQYKQDKQKALIIEGVIKKITHFDDALEKYRRQQWHYRMHGFWFMLNGVPTWLTQKHWFYLQWTKLDHPVNDGYPLFYHPQLDRYYFRGMCAEDPYCFGWAEGGPRGYGKTSEISSWTVEEMTRPPHRRHAAIQSKTEDDAVDVVFQEKMVPIFNNLPEFFKPEFSHGTNPSKKFTFRRKSNTSKDGKKLPVGDMFELNNTVRCFPAKEKAVDGKTLALVVADESGKTDKSQADVYKRLAIHIKCVFRNQRKVGIIMMPSTVEEMDEGGDEFYEVWKESDIHERDANGYTKSKLYRYMVTGMECKVQLADKFGEIDLVKAETMMDAERAPFLDDPEKLSLIMRKDPKNEAEMFIKDQARSDFNTFIVASSISRLELMQRKQEKATGVRKIEPDGRQVKLEWVDDIVDGHVKMVDNPNGMFTIFFEPDKMRNGRQLLNACEFYMDDGKKIWLPVNNDLYRSGGDPVRSMKTSDPRASKFSAYGYVLYDANYDHGKDPSEWVTDNMMWQYFGRSEDPDDDFEQLIMAMRLFGHSMMPENNISDFTKHLIGRGYQKFIIVRKNFDPSVLMQKGGSKNALGADQAVQSTEEVIQSWYNEGRRWWKKKGMRNRSLVLARQSRDFTLKERTKFDAVVGWCYTLLSLKAELEDMTKSPVWAQTQDSLFKKYNISGTQSRAIEQGDQDDDHDFGPDKLQRLLNS